MVKIKLEIQWGKAQHKSRRGMGQGKKKKGQKSALLETGLWQTPGPETGRTEVDEM